MSKTGLIFKDRNDDDNDGKDLTATVKKIFSGKTADPSDEDRAIHAMIEKRERERADAIRNMEDLKGRMAKVSRRIREYVGEGDERSAEIERHTLNMLFDEYLVVAEMSK